MVALPMAKELHSPSSLVLKVSSEMGDEDDGGKEGEGKRRTKKKRMKLSEERAER